MNGTSWLCRVRAGLIGLLVDDLLPRKSTLELWLSYHSTATRAQPASAILAGGGAIGNQAGAGVVYILEEKDCMLRARKIVAKMFEWL